MIYDEKYWNDKYVKKSVLYKGRTMRNKNTPIEIDVKNFITVNDEILKKYIDKYELKKETHNETAYAIQKFAVQNLKYVGDDVNAGISEFWQFSFETLANINNGCDCEDGAILMASLMICAGIPSYRVKVAAGYVKVSPTSPSGGHAYPLFLADREDGSQKWEIHDWCFYQDIDVPTGKKPLAKMGGYNNSYGQIWWTFNNEYSWSNQEVVVSQGRVNK